MNHKDRIKIYEAGPIDQTEDGGISWRSFTTPILERLGEVLRPANVQRHRREIEELRKEAGDQKRWWIPLRYYVLCQEIVNDALKLVNDADIIVAYYNPTISTVGTIMEILQATGLEKPVFVYTDGYGTLEMPTFIVGTGCRICADLEELEERIGFYKDVERWKEKYEENES